MKSRGKDTGLRNLPLYGFTHNRIWIAIVALAVELTAWMQMLALTGHPARRWEPKRLRLRLLTVAGRIAQHARRVCLRLASHAPWVDLLLHGLPAPTRPAPPHLTSRNPSLRATSTTIGQWNPTAPGRQPASLTNPNTGSRTHDNPGHGLNPGRHPTKDPG